MLLASRHSIIAEEQGAQQECSSTLSSLFGVSIFNIILFVFLLGADYANYTEIIPFRFFENPYSPRNPHLKSFILSVLS